MKYTIAKILTLTSIIVLTGCAAVYQPINPQSLSYTSLDLQDGIGFSYKYDVLRERGNKRYAKKEFLNRIKLIAVKVTNNSDTVINIGKNAAFYSDQHQVLPIDPMQVKETIKQIVPSYIPYILLTFVNLYISDGSGTTRIPIGLALGPIFTVSNLTKAGSSNKILLRELNKFNLLNKDIEKGETVYGIIGIRDNSYGQLSVKMTE